MDAPPLEEGAVHVRATEVLPNVGVTEVGTPGVVRGVADGDVDEYAPVPTLFTAATRNT
jgi:hypothetical protein